jgi:hypothetical protein
VEQNGNSLSLTPIETSGSVTSAQELSGTVDMPMGFAFLTRAASRVEGPRANGHTFYVTEASADSVWFISSVETFPGTHTEVNMSARGTSTMVFRESSASGPVYTTCVFGETFTGWKL